MAVALAVGLALLFPAGSAGSGDADTNFISGGESCSVCGTADVSSGAEINELTFIWEGPDNVMVLELQPRRVKLLSSIKGGTANSTHITFTALGGQSLPRVLRVSVGGKLRTHPFLLCIAAVPFWMDGRAARSTAATEAARGPSDRGPWL